jgi:hypothetical protein
VSKDHQPRGRTGPWHWLYALTAALLLGAGLWAYAQFAPDLQASWSTWKAHGAERLREALLWLEFFGSILLSVLVLLWLTALLFALFLGGAYLLTRLLRWTIARLPAKSALRRACRWLLALLGREREVGTALNLAASAGALGLVVWVSGLPFDAWDLGIQALIALLIELIVLGVLFREGRVAWLSRDG